jgi:hypothetical protein
VHHSPLGQGDGEDLGGVVRLAVGLLPATEPVREDVRRTRDELSRYA